MPNETNADKCKACGKQWVNHYGISHTCETLQSLWLHAINCREAQINSERHSSPIAFIARKTAEEKLDDLLIKLKSGKEKLED
jgi:hypothetical protein